ncbi:MAG TPA: hypothetical protein PL037_05705 [Elusimicrobiales bacterium]|nr:hypothetical protein [Elusimicrobiales bacterium]
MKHLRYAAFSVSVVIACSGGLFAETFDPLDKFKTNVADGLVKPFAADLGGIIGGADFSSGRTIGFPGFDVGAVGMVQTKPGKDNLILRNANVKGFGLGLLQASVALPFLDTDISVRGVSYSGFTLAGGGLRHSILRSGPFTKFIPDVSAAVFFDTVNYKYFTARHLSADLSASFDLPLIKPFIGAGYDRTRVAIKGVSAALDGMDAIASKPRYSAGARIVPFPFLYVFGAYTVLHGRNGFNFGAGARF